MMKTISTLLLLVLFPLVIFSQGKGIPVDSKTSKNYFLDLSVGASIPIGSSYPDTDIDNEKAGFATTGYYLQGTFDWMGKRNLGLAIQIAYQSNPINSMVKNDTVKGNSFPVGSGNWQNIYIMAGPVFLKSIQQFIVDVKLLGGFIISMSPAFSTTNRETHQKDEITATGFGIGIHAGGAYKINKNVAVQLNIGYVAGFPSVSKQYNASQVYDTVLQKIIYTAPSEIKISKTVSTFTAGVGMIYIF
jgi:hypothetical protein